MLKASLDLFNTFLAVDFREYRRLLREKRGAGDTTGEAEEAPGPPAESVDMRGNQQRSLTKLIDNGKDWLIGANAVPKNTNNQTTLTKQKIHKFQSYMC